MENETEIETVEVKETARQRMQREIHEIYELIEHIKPLVMSITQSDVDKVAKSPMFPLLKSLAGNLTKG